MSNQLFFDLKIEEAEKINKEYKINSINKPLFREISEVNKPISSEQKIVINTVLQARMAKMKYDRVGIAYDFLNHFLNLSKEDPKLKPIEAISDFSPDFSSRIYSGGSACVGLTLDLSESLPSDLVNYVIPARLHKKVHQFAFPELCHTAVIIPYYIDEYKNNKGYILLDTSFDIPVGIDLNPDNRNVEIDMGEKKGIWTFSLIDDTKIVCHTNQDDFKDSESNMIFYLKEFTNPIESSAIPMFTADRELVLLRRNDKGIHYGNIKIELDKKRIVSTISGERKAPIKFSEIEDNTTIFNLETYEALDINQEELDKIIYKIIKNINILDTLYIDYLRRLLALNNININLENNIKEKEEVNLI